MSSRSPRGSFSDATSAEVAADFADSLKDLSLNNRFEITGLTVIAKENTEHAEVISQTLESHIKSTSPSRKLPALYVLDSIVKNVGDPYTTYLGRNLYKTFMDAYLLVDTTTRKQMEGMLKTWKEPVPGSIDNRPVFPLDKVRPINDALIKAKTAAIQNQRHGQSSQIAFRGVATPPQMQGQFSAPPTHGFQHPYANFPTGNPIVQQQHAPNTFSYHQHHHLMSPDVDTIQQDIALVLARESHASAMNPTDVTLRTRVQALSDLQNLLATQTFNPTDLNAIKAQVQQLSSAGRQPPQPPQVAPQPAPTWAHFAQPTNSYATAPLPLQTHQQLQVPATTPGLTTFNPETLNGLQALLAHAPKPSTPQMRAAVPSFRDASHASLHAIQNHAANVPAAAPPLDLLSSLTKAGLINLGPNATPVPVSVAPAQPAQDQTAMLLKSLQSILPSQSENGTPKLPAASLAVGAADVPVSAAALRIFRPELVTRLYEAQPNQCSMCGRRFDTTDDGREKKSRHLDWHFRTNQRIADPNSNRGYHRNWYIDELEWVKHIEFDPSTTTNAPGDLSSPAKAKKNSREQVVRAPAGMTKNTCNICFEEMKSTYSEDLQDWVFADATTNNGRIVHAQCLAEMTRAQPGDNSLAAALSAANGGGRERSATPDSLLGKRKAEDAISRSSIRVRTG